MAYLGGVKSRVTRATSPHRGPQGPPSADLKSLLQIQTSPAFVQKITHKSQPSFKFANET